MNAQSRIVEGSEPDPLTPFEEVCDQLDQHRLALSLAQSYVMDGFLPPLLGPKPDVMEAAVASDKVHALLGVVIRDLDASRRKLDSAHVHLVHRRHAAQSAIGRHVQLKDWISPNPRIAAGIRRWEAALDRYQTAKSEYEREAQGYSDDPPASLDDAVVDAVAKLVDTRAPDLAALKQKLEVLQLEGHAGEEGVLEAIIADVDALASEARFSSLRRPAAAAPATEGEG